MEIDLIFFQSDATDTKKKKNTIYFLSFLSHNHSYFLKIAPAPPWPHTNLPLILHQKVPFPHSALSLRPTSFVKASCIIFLPVDDSRPSHTWTIVHYVLYPFESGC